MKKVLKILSCILILTGLTLLIPVSGGCSEPEEENVFIRLLGLLPATAKEGRVIVLIDHEKWRQVNGISVYKEGGQRINGEEYIERMKSVGNDSGLLVDNMVMHGSYWTGISSYMTRSPICNETIGYEYSDIDAEIHNLYSISVPWMVEPYMIGLYSDVMVVAVGELSAESTNEALGNSDEWSSELVNDYVSEDYKNIIIHSWGDGQKMRLGDRLSPPHNDNIGRAIPVAVSDGQLFFGGSVDHIKSMIDTRRGESSSLADVTEYALIAAGMYDLGAIGAFIMDEAHNREIVESISPRKELQI